MARLWSGDDEKIQLSGGVEGGHNQTALPSPPHPRPEKSNVRRSHPPVWEMISSDQGESQKFDIGGLDGAVVRRDQSTGVANPSRTCSSKSKLHPFCKVFVANQYVPFSAVHML